MFRYLYAKFYPGMRRPWRSAPGVVGTFGQRSVVVGNVGQWSVIAVRVRLVQN